jgi:hypothetical protein
MKLFVGEVIPELKALKAVRLKQKETELRPYVEAFERKKYVKQLDEADVPIVVAAGHKVVEQSRARHQLPAIAKCAR